MVRTVCGVAAIALAIACGGGAGTKDGSIPVDPGPGGGGGGGGGTNPDLPCDGKITLRLRGLGLGDGQTVTLAVSGVEVRAAGLPVPTSFAAYGDATFPVDGAYRMAVVPTPAAGGMMHATFQVASGTWCDPGGCAPLDTCGAHVAFELDPGRVRPDTCHVVVHLDLARGVVLHEGGRVLLPRYAVHY